MSGRQFTVSLPSPALIESVGSYPDVSLVHWDLHTPAPRTQFDIVVAPYLEHPSVLAALTGLTVGLVQSQSIGFDGVDEHLPPGMLFANATSVHETSTAELAVGLMLSMQRGIADFVRASERHEWKFAWYPSLADRRVLIVGYGAVGRALEARLAPFEVEVTRVASTARVEEGALGQPVHIHGMKELGALLPQADIVVLTVPLSEQTHQLANAEFLAAMPDGAMLVNVSRGPVVDTDALVAEVTSGRLRAGLDVTDPEPLPAKHPLWGLPNVIVSPHVGGASSAMLPRVTRLIRTQIERMLAGQPPVNVVLGGLST